VSVGGVSGTPVGCGCTVAVTVRAPSQAIDGAEAARSQKRIRDREERLDMAYGAFAETKARYRDLETLVDYRAYDGDWTAMFEERWLKPRLKALGYSHIRFFGGKTCGYDGSFRERVCELARPGDARAEFFVYG